MHSSSENVRQGVEMMANTDHGRGSPDSQRDEVRVVSEDRPAVSSVRHRKKLSDIKIEAINGDMDNQLDSSLVGSPFGRVGISDGSLGSGSAQADCTSPDTPTADIAPVFHEIDPLLSDDFNLPDPIKNCSDSHFCMPPQDPKIDGDSNDETDKSNAEENDEKNVGADPAFGSCDDEKNVMDLGYSEMERNRRNSQLSSFHSAPRKNRFDYTSEQSDENDLHEHDNFGPHEFMEVSHQDMFFRKHESFNLGSQGKRLSRFKPCFVLDPMDIEDSMASDFQMQFSCKTLHQEKGSVQASGIAVKYIHCKKLLKEKIIMQTITSQASLQLLEGIVNANLKQNTHAARCQPPWSKNTHMPVVKNREDNGHAWQQSDHVSTLQFEPCGCGGVKQLFLTYKNRFGGTRGSEEAPAANSESASETVARFLVFLVPLPGTFRCSPASDPAVYRPKVVFWEGTFRLCARFVHVELGSHPAVAVTEMVASP
ncbi:hypothetical protein GUJ93_ZPchr0039g14225 [Zizania palustris]|uniref:Uncharacterized protein n=1 Tax=Zizania palustris TaxID=103762 RepID=A0A8J5USD0_ZIZPA|nr:hypothetical protein GUJ93_ZPchr0039g14225 [Zizania palustris]